MCLKFTVLVLSIIDSSQQNGIFDESSKITFLPDAAAEYFGYSVVLSDSGLIVGAPKARSRTKSTAAPGMVFKCSLNAFNETKKYCRPYGITDQGRDYTTSGHFIGTNDFFRNDMWFGATIAPVPHGKLLICAPRWSFMHTEDHLLVNGACYLQTKKRGRAYYPLREPSHLAYISDGKRREYGVNGTHLNFYAHGQAGLAAKVVSNDTVIVGAPGVLQWTGAIIDYRYIFDEDTWLMSKHPTTNPYFTKELGPDDYFGYSVESGVFDKSGKVLYVGGAPRSRNGYGQVLIFESALRETAPLNVKAKVQGPQLGSYFGASLCALDIDGDGLSELVVGAPNYINKNSTLPYDQGGVFVYSPKLQVTGFSLTKIGFVSGSEKSGGRFGSSIADLGDIDGDGFKDVAISAPWEDSGKGAVYIYRGNKMGLLNQYDQRIQPEGAKGFGMSISPGYDVDENNCNDLSVGAHASQSAYVYRCVQSIHINCSIKVPDQMNLNPNATNFTALFCVHAAPKKPWPKAKIGLRATITVDPESQRATLSGNSQYELVISPAREICKEHIVVVKSTADLSKPISIHFKLDHKDNMTPVPKEATRLSKSSNLESKLSIQLTRDCGDDLICKPKLEMKLEALNETYIPGTETRVGVKVTVLNKEEPAYSSKVFLNLPSSPKRVPSGCEYLGNNITCDVPSPLQRMEEATWEIELEYTKRDSEERDLRVVAVLKSAENYGNTTGDFQELTLHVKPEAVFRVSGKSLPNSTVAVSREKLSLKESVLFYHFYEITNHGPSDWFNTEVELHLPEKIILTKSVKGCAGQRNASEYICIWSIRARVSLPVMLPLKFDLSHYGALIEKYGSFNVSTVVKLTRQNKTESITTRLILEPATPIWPLILGAITGLAILAAIVYKLQQYGFFLRQRREEMNRLLEQNSIHEMSGFAANEVQDTEDITQELLFDCSE